MKGLLVPILLTLVAIMLFFGVTKPILAEMQTKQAEMTALLANLDLAEQVADKRSKLIDDYNKYPGEDKQKIDHMLPDNIDNVQFVIDLRAKAASLDIDLKDLSLGENILRARKELGPDTSTLGALTLTFSMTGSYQKIQSLISLLASSLRPIEISSMNFVAGKNDNYQANFTIKTYWLK